MILLADLLGGQGGRSSEPEDELVGLNGAVQCETHPDEIAVVGIGSGRSVQFVDAM